MRIAMLCLGNICRSPMAEAVARALVADAGLTETVRVESFGTAGYHVGGRAEPRAEAALRRAGWAVSPHVVRQISVADLAAVDLWCCADRSNLAKARRLAARLPNGPELSSERIRLLRSFDPAAPEGAEVPDPWARDAEDFDRALALIESACRGLVDRLSDKFLMSPSGRAQPGVFFTGASPSVCDWRLSALEPQGQTVEGADPLSRGWLGAEQTARE